MDAVIKLIPKYTAVASCSGYWPFLLMDTRLKKSKGQRGNLYSTARAENGDPNFRDWSRDAACSRHLSRAPGAHFATSSPDLTPHTSDDAGFKANCVTLDPWTLWGMACIGLLGNQQVYPSFCLSLRIEPDFPGRERVRLGPSPCPDHHRQSHPQICSACTRAFQSYALSYSYELLRCESRALTRRLAK